MNSETCGSLILSIPSLLELNHLQSNRAMFKNYFRKITLAFCLVFLFVSSTHFAGAQTASHPRLEKQGSRTVLVVNNKPFLMLAGELHNSSSSNLQYMGTVWSKLAQMNLNTVLTPLSWELIEPQEGKFDFSLVDGLIKKARMHKLKLVFLWFGSWKNLVSTYAPAWVKNNPERFALHVNKSGERYQMLSSFSTEAMRADTKAFAALMKHIKQVDAVDQTVIMMQVENEVGTYSNERDCSKMANESYDKQVPEKLIDYLTANKSNLIPSFKDVWGNNGFKTKGSWKEIFGEGGPSNEIFMSWYLASYIGEVIRAGKAEYNIPMYVNAAIGRQNAKIGTYPSGSPLPFVMDVWRAAAPQLDMLSPDIYFGVFTDLCQAYTQSGNPLFIPETRGGEFGAANAVTAIGNYNAIGFSPFGIDGRFEDPASGIPSAYKTLQQLSPLILKSESLKQMISVSLDSGKKNSTVTLGNYQIDCNLQAGFPSFGNSSPAFGNSPLGYAIIIQTGKDEFFVAGKNISLQFSLKDNKEKITAFEWAEEGNFNNGVWVPGRRMNGDQIMVNYSFSDLFKDGKSGNGLRFTNRLGIQKVKLYQY